MVLGLKTEGAVLLRTLQDITAQAILEQSLLVLSVTIKQREASENRVGVQPTGDSR